MQGMRWPKRHSVPALHSARKGRLRIFLIKWRAGTFSIFWPPMGGMARGGNVPWCRFTGRLFPPKWTLGSLCVGDAPRLGGQVLFILPAPNFPTRTKGVSTTPDKVAAKDKENEHNDG